ncbi:MAG: lamin tail domain-containing protein [Kiritimatiellae bacterium]|nr:lamin tail domain-containing protein [Kiritimatiellia bacterium]
MRLHHRAAAYGLFAAVFAAAIGFVPALHADTLVSRGGTWKYLKGTAEASPEDAGAWREADFDDAAWPSASAPFGYGNAAHELNTIQTTLADMTNAPYTCVFLRKAFTVADVSLMAGLALNVCFDDGFIVWVNGERVADVNEPDVVAHDAVADGDHECGSDGAGVYESFALGLDAGAVRDLLVEGVNVMAVQAFNAGALSSDFVIDVELVTVVADTKFSTDRGFYDAAFDLTITSATPGATVFVTTDGRPPSPSDYDSQSANAAVVHVDKTMPVRAMAARAGDAPTDVDTHTYIFLADVLAQPANPSGYPATWIDDDGDDSVPADYGMDPNVVNDARYRADITNDMKSIPSLCLTLDKDDLFDRYSGILANFTDEREWERGPIAAELIHPDGTAGFRIDCGIKMSGASRHLPMYKTSFQLKFRAEYGASKLDYKLFPNTAVTRHDSIKLRSNMNDFLRLQPRRGQGCRDQWSRDTQNEMGWPSPDGTFVHLYINGLYWGVYNPCERVSEGWLAENFGGEKQDYDIMGCWNIDEPRDGTNLAWLALRAAADTDLSDPANYAQVAQLLDIRQSIDYHLLYMYMNATDWDYWVYWWNGYPQHSFNNWRAARKSRNRMPGDIQFQFYCWDAETNPEIRDRGAMPDTLATAGVACLHSNLLANADYRTLFADRIYKHLISAGGLLTPSAATARYVKRADEIKRAMVCEFARWGDVPILYEDPKPDKALWNDYFNATGGGTRVANADGYDYLDYHARSLDDEWLPELARLTNGFFQTRTATCVTWFRDHGYYPSVEAPSFSQEGGAIASGFRLTLSATGYTIYYTLDGADPRLAGGSIAGSAVRYEGPVTLAKTTHVQARVRKSAGTWSAVHAATFNYTGHYSRLRITEIQYNPPGGRAYEFVEIKNTGSATRGLSDMRLGGVGYTFAPGAELDAGKFALLVADEPAFDGRYPGVKTSDDVQLFGVYNGRLDNGGERVALLDSDGRTVVGVRYNDKDPWPGAADGDGHSLVPAALDGFYDDSAADDAATWRASNLIGGSPGRDDGAPYRVLISEALTHTDLPQVDAVELYNAGSAAADIGGWYLSDSADSYRKYRIPDATVLPAGGYAVFDEHAFNTDTNDPACFALDSHGDELYLTCWDEKTNLLYRAEARFGGADNGVAFARYVTTAGDTDFVAQNTTNTLGLANAAPRVGPVVITEIMYHPAEGEEEFIELLNTGGAAVPLYDAAYPSNTWQLGAAVDYAFPPGTDIGPGEYVLVVATNDAAFRSRYGIPAGIRIFGPYAGRLNNGGESVKLWRPGEPDEAGVPWILADRVKYNDNDPWPESADGGGPSLERQDPAAYGNDPANWAASVNAGGTPGSANSGGLVSKGAGWWYHDLGADLGTGWRAAGYDDSAWDSGNGPLGYAYPELDTTISYGENPDAKPMTAYFRKRFTLAAEPGNVTALTLKMKYDDGFVAYLNGEEIARGAMPAGTVTFDTAADGHTASDYEPFDLAAHIGKLVQGLNVLAVEAHQTAATSSDLFMDAELVHATSTLPAVQFAATGSSGGEAVSPAYLAVALSSACAQTVTVNYAVSGGSATGGGADYALSGGTLTFTAGETARNVALIVVDDAVGEQPETVVVSLSGPVNAVLGANATHTFTIADNDTVEPVEVFAAYNDFGWETGQLADNITTNSIGSVELVRHGTGAGTGITLASDYGGAVANWTPTNLVQGTDAYALFNGKVDCDGFISTSSGEITLTLSGLKTNALYEFAVFGNRAGGYLDRLAAVTVSDVAAFENQSSSGADFAGPAAPSTVICNGENTANGYVARFGKVEAGPDGDAVLTLSLASGSTAYFSAFVLKEYSTQGGSPVRIPKGSAWRYAAGTAEASAPPAAWRQVGFADAGWSTGNAPFGYGPATYGTTLTGMQDSYSCVFLRNSFLVGSPALVSELRLWVRYDDGFIAWVNGEEIARVNMPADPFVACDGHAAAWIGDAAEWSNAFVQAQIPVLRAGTNSLALQVFNQTTGSADFIADAELAVVEAPFAADDSDGDAMSDGWETGYFGGSAGTGETDSDGDGLTDAAEFILGTDPTTNASLFAVGLSACPGGVVASFLTVPAAGTGYDGLERYYALEAQAGFQGAWSAVPGYTNLLGAGQTVAYTNTSGAAGAWYRARVWLDH